VTATEVARWQEDLAAVEAALKEGVSMPDDGVVLPVGWGATLVVFGVIVLVFLAVGLGVANLIALQRIHDLGGQINVVLTHIVKTSALRSRQNHTILVLLHQVLDLIKNQTA
jgi:hypothetical protein